MFRRFFHVNICVSDMERSIRFYESLGFTKQALRQAQDKLRETIFALFVAVGEIASSPAAPRNDSSPSLQTRS